MHMLQMYFIFVSNKNLLYIPVNAQIKSQILTSDKNKNKPQ